MQWRNTANNYGAVAKFLHWAIVILIIAQYVIIEAAEELPDGLEKLRMVTNHKSFGMLVLLRLCVSLYEVPSQALAPERADVPVGH